MVSFEGRKERMVEEAEAVIGVEREVEREEVVGGAGRDEREG